MLSQQSATVDAFCGAQARRLTSAIREGLLLFSENVFNCTKVDFWNIEQW